ncbi:hypothetical protein [Chryseobacterium defluvii]|uniref:Immunity protein 26 of polymorphic toxin system n=1 Tax=Chryseobacterium defluvii TaxID=160396 RepID=A0A495SNC7_9FLAO|nr:hypothetical protein [Chryseobacterium defluvii]RKT01778.1 hypothetical protein BCF58_1003 [Chryseobacterium defluvii]
MKSFELGNLYTIDTNKGLGLFQLVNIPEDKKNEVEMIRVSYHLFPDIPKDIDEVFSDDFFYVCFPVKAALRKKVINLVGHQDLPENFSIPRFYRIEHYFNKGEWIIVDNKSENIEQVKSLSDDQLKLSPDGVWTDLYLKDRLEEGWRLENWK